MNNKLKSADVLTLQGAFDVCYELFQKTSHIEGQKALRAACEVFQQAIKDIDAEYEKHRIEMMTARPITERARRTWNNYVDEHCEKMTDLSDYEGEEEQK